MSAINYISTHTYTHLYLHTYTHLYISTYLSTSLHLYVVCFPFKWFVSQTPYLIHECTKAPHITGCGVLLVDFYVEFNTLSATHVGLSVCRYSLRSPFFTSSNTIIGYQEDLIYRTGHNFVGFKFGEFRES